TAADGRNCGGCGRVCPPVRNGTGSCEAGQCTAACNPGFLHCSMVPEDGCEVNGAVDVSNCGACRNACRAVVSHGQVGCAAGTCIVTRCDAGFADCNKMAGDGCEVQTASDSANCGVCGNACNAVPNATASCSNGRCMIGMCNAGFADCDG